MRTLEQIYPDLRKARKEADAANQRVERLENEVREIYNSAKEALGIQEYQPR